MRTYRTVSIEFFKEENGKQKKTATIPIRTASMISKSKTGFKQACPSCKGHVGRKNWCDTCNREIEFGNILKGIDDKVFSKEQIESLKTFDQKIKVLGPFSYDEIDIRKVQGGYYLLPVQLKKGTSVSAKASRNLNDYAVIVQGLAETNTVLLVEYCVSSVQKLGIILNDGKELILKEYAYAENLVTNDEDLNYTPSKQEVEGIVKFLNRQKKEKDISSIENEYFAKFIGELHTMKDLSRTSLSSCFHRQRTPSNSTPLQRNWSCIWIQN